MKHDMNVFIMKYIGEGITEGLNQYDKEITISSMGFSNEASLNVARGLMGNNDAMFHVEIEESQLLEISGQICSSIIQSLGSDKLHRVRELTYERNVDLVGAAAADAIRRHDEEVLALLTVNLHKLVNDAGFRVSVANRCHLKIVQ